MNSKCPYCQLNPELRNESPSLVIRFGTYRRKSDGRSVQRLRCTSCKRTFSSNTYHDCYRQNKRHKNESLRLLFVSGVSQRRSARILRISRTTVVRKFLFLAKRAQLKFQTPALQTPHTEIYFDDMETFEHSKHKPLSITLAVNNHRQILAFRVAQMSARGPLVHFARRKYGRRRDFRKIHRRSLLRELKDRFVQFETIKSDENPHYVPDVKAILPNVKHVTFKGARAAVTGQGELKNLKFDPLFKLNHTCAMLRANVNRLFRKTWNTTKKRERLLFHIAIYSQFHNEELVKLQSPF